MKSKQRMPRHSAVRSVATVLVLWIPSTDGKRQAVMWGGRENQKDARAWWVRASGKMRVTSSSFNLEYSWMLSEMEKIRNSQRSIMFSKYERISWKLRKCQDLPSCTRTGVCAASECATRFGFCAPRYHLAAVLGVVRHLPQGANNLYGL